LREVSTRVWLDGELWEQLSDRAIAEGVTVRDLVPRLVGQAIAPAPPAPVARAPLVSATSAPAGAPPVESGPPILVLSDVYRCAVCDAVVKVGGLTIHMGKHMKELRAPEAERS
jgi:hypothetical protein